MAFIAFKKSKMRNAINNGDAHRVAYLLNQGVSPNLKDDYGRSFLYHAVVKGNLEIVLLLLDRGAAVSSSLEFRGSILHAAAENGDPEIGRLLLERNPRLLNLQTSVGNTALHIATRLGHEEFAKMLLERKCDTTIRNQDNRTALFFARAERRDALVALLQPPETPKKEPLVFEGWKKISEDKIAYVSIDRTLGYKLTEVYNFRAQDRTQLYQNIETRAESVDVRPFVDIPDHTDIDNALAQLKKMGGRSDITVAKPKNLSFRGGKP